MSSDNFENHILLYSKGWYGVSGDGIIVDLKVLLSKFAAIDIEFISDGDIIQLLSSAFAKYVKSEHEISEALFEITGYKWDKWGEKFIRKPEEVMVSKLNIVIWGADISKKMELCSKMDILFV